MEKRKKNVDKFDMDVQKWGGYEYTTNKKLSSYLANKRMIDVLRDYDKKYSLFEDRAILDIGCGDGEYTFGYLELGCKIICGIDPSIEGIKRANSIVLENKYKGISFSNINIYDMDELPDYDLGILRGVLHHVSDQEEALKCVSKKCEKICIQEPNGLNPILKVIEKVSKYHIEHEEQSFTLGKMKKWVMEAGYEICSTKYYGLVPFFAPDWLAKLCNVLAPIVESIPVLRCICCGQYIILAQKK